MEREKLDFVERFKDYEVPLESADKVIAKMDESHRQQYFLQARELLTNEVLRTELDEWKRKVYASLALHSQTDLEREGLRRTLMAITDFENRLKTLGMGYAAKRLESISDKL